MASDPWDSRLAAAKRHCLLQQQQSSSSDRIDVDEYELEDEVRSGFPCPFCDEDHDIVSLCSHLEDEHPFQYKAAVCPVCSVKVAGEMRSHIMLQHGRAFKRHRHRRLRRIANRNGQALSLLGRDLFEAHPQVLLGGGAFRSGHSSTSAAAADSFLSSIELNFPPSEAEETSKSSLSDDVDDFIGNNSTTKAGNSSIDLSLSQEEREKRLREATARAKFVQDLLISTLFDD